MPLLEQAHYYQTRWLPHQEIDAHHHAPLATAPGPSYLEAKVVVVEVPVVIDFLVQFIFVLLEGDS